MMGVPGGREPNKSTTRETSSENRNAAMSDPWQPMESPPADTSIVQPTSALAAAQSESTPTASSSLGWGPARRPAVALAITFVVLAVVAVVLVTSLVVSNSRPVKLAMPSSLFGLPRITSGPLSKVPNEAISQVKQAFPSTYVGGIYGHSQGGLIVMAIAAATALTGADNGLAQISAGMASASGGRTTVDLAQVSEVRVGSVNYACAPGVESGTAGGVEIQVCTWNDGTTGGQLVFFGPAPAMSDAERAYTAIVQR
jgi:hypothetical protein